MHSDSGIDLVFAAAACNRQPGALTTLHSHKVAAYGSFNNAVILDVSSLSVSTVLQMHKSVVTSTKLTFYKDSILLFASTSDGTVGLATRLNEKWHVAETPLKHDGSCIAVEAVYSGNDILVASVGLDGQIRSTSYDGNLFSNIQSSLVVPNPSGRETLPECVAMYSFTDNSTLIAVGGTDRRIQLYSANRKDSFAPKFLTYLDGHRDWVRGLSFSNTSAGVFLASASKDSSARVWHIASDSSKPSLQSFLPSPTVNVDLSDIFIRFTAVALLDEHTAAVHSVSFPMPGTQPHVVTSSMDCSVAIWRLTKSDAQCVARFGLMGGQSAHALGFFGAEFVNAGVNNIIAHNFSGALHRWATLKPTDGSKYEYFAHPALTGHFDQVTDLSWAPDGSFLLTCSADKTARIFAECQGSFVEWARPQVHGHAIFALAFCNNSGTRYVSGAEERMLRIFEAPSSFQLPGELGIEPEWKPTSASLPQLGLSNKPVFAEKKAATAHEANDMLVSTFGVEKAKAKAPLEEELKQSRLWPETAKLYGHGNEISAVAVDIERGILASACRAQAAKDAVILLWDINTGAECAKLAVHQLTVNDLIFSTDGTELASVSRDRSVAVFEKKSAGSPFGFSVKWHRKSAHSRLLYCCSWISDNEIVATGGRDKTLRMFFSSESESRDLGDELLKYKFDSGVTALDSFRPSKNENRSTVVAGFDNGAIRVLSLVWDRAFDVQLELISNLSQTVTCGARITGLSWRPTKDNSVSMQRQVAVASEDHSVRIYRFVWKERS